jgi:hypothetical protein
VARSKANFTESGGAFNAECRWAFRINGERRDQILGHGCNSPGALSARDIKTRFTKSGWHETCALQRALDSTASSTCTGS